MNIFQNLFRPNLDKLKSKQDLNGLLRALKKYSEKEDEFSTEISSAIADILEEYIASKDFRLFYRETRLWFAKPGISQTEFDKFVISTISNIIVDIGTVDTLINIRETIEKYRLGEIEIPYGYRSLFFTGIERKLRRKLLPITSPLELSIAKLNDSWEKPLKKLAYPEYNGESIKLAELKRQYEQGKVKGEEKCEVCFHKAMVTIEDTYSNYVGQRLDSEYYAKGICLYCGYFVLSQYP